MVPQTLTKWRPPARKPLNGWHFCCAFWGTLKTQSPSQAGQPYLSCKQVTYLWNPECRSQANNFGNLDPVIYRRHEAFWSWPLKLKPQSKPEGFTRVFLNNAFVGRWLAWNCCWKPAVRSCQCSLKCTWLLCVYVSPLYWAPEDLEWGSKEVIARLAAAKEARRDAAED